MRSKRLGCITPLGLLGALITMLAIGVAGWTSGGALFSPGELSALEGPELGGVTSHAATGGQCEACHTAPWDPTGMSARCLDCHQSVEAELTDPGTLHGGLLADRAAGNPATAGRSGEVNCRECHTEHHGPDATLTRLDMQNFPHDLTGFSLQAHETNDNGIAFACEDCHQDDFRRMETIVCKDCHTELDALAMDQHTAAFGLECLHCHDGVDRFGADFDHGRTDFALTGEHGALLCQDCHQGQTTPEELAATPQDCAACHNADDPHEGQFGADCAECHTTGGWTPANFDHNQRTDFPLVGKHVEAACADCHANNVYAGTQDTCIACHREDDDHQGRYGTDCAACHTPEAWAPATFDHAGTAFPLTGEHTQVDCLDCHVDGQFTGTPQQCVACHSSDDEHRGQFGSDCAACHSTSDWSAVTFDHANTAFQLTGAHGSVPCLECHSGGQFSGTPTVCVQCHAEPQEHMGQFGTDCAMCHSTSAWEPAGYDGPHTFPMDHGDANSCRDCHPGSLTTWTCYNCHDQGEVAEDHQDEGIADFANCMRCHANGEEDGGDDGDRNRGRGRDDDDDDD